HEHKQKIADLADSFVSAPGGAGCLEEFFEVYNWAQIGLHQKHICIFNINQFYKPLEALITPMIHAGFIDKKYEKLAGVYETPQSLLEGLKNAKPISTRTYD
ncbi:TIGR00730 family Rossman fold protein, partial [Staphylococcus pseudintermedius]|uniref:LOG family protein n=1 Tax=Staphylococcus pseudintermedius TaxID=283734 RepID=UPI000E394304